MNSEITHRGIIERVDGSHITVRITQIAACSSCGMAKHCNAAESKDKIIDVYTNVESEKYEVGEDVTISITKNTAHRAVIMGFCLPLVVLVGTLLTTKALHFDDDAAALLSIASLLPYYLCVWLLRDVIASKVSFHIERLNNKTK